MAVETIYITMSQKHCLKMESLPHDVVERIMESLPVKSLLRFKAVSKQWKSTIESRFFQERQLKQRQESGDPDVLIVAGDIKPDNIEYLTTLVLGSSSPVNIPTLWVNDTKFYFVCESSCREGLVCLYHPLKPGLVVNPTTRWHRPLPLSNFQRFFNCQNYLAFPSLGFGKDKTSGTYKPVWLYNSLELGLENATTCEVFDFSTNAWRYLTSSSPYRIIMLSLYPAYVDGLLFWFTECEQTKVLSFDLHTKTFQVISKAPFANVKPCDIVMCNLDNRLCVSQMKLLNQAQVIWSFDSDNKTWHNLYTIDLNSASSCLEISYALTPLGIFKKYKKNMKKLLFCGNDLNVTLVIHDPKTKSYDVAFSSESTGTPVCYFPTLISIL